MHALKVAIGIINTGRTNYCLYIITDMHMYVYTAHHGGEPAGSAVAPWALDL